MALMNVVWHEFEDKDLQGGIAWLLIATRSNLDIF